MTTNSGQEHAGEGVAALEKLTRERDEARAEAARLDSIIDDMLPVTADGRHVFIDGTGCVEIDLGRKMRARIAALEAENAALRRDGERLANASDNFCSRFTMNDLAEDDDRQRQAALDQSRLFRAILGEQP